MPLMVHSVPLPASFRTLSSIFLTCWPGARVAHASRTIPANTPKSHVVRRNVIVHRIQRFRESNGRYATRAALRNLYGGLLQPVAESPRTELRAVARHQFVPAHFDPVIAPLRIGNHFA